MKVPTNALRGLCSTLVLTISGLLFRIGRSGGEEVWLMWETS